MQAPGNLRQKQLSDLPADIITRVRNAVVSAFHGLDGGARARIGQLLVSGRFYTGVAATNANVNVLEILLGTTSPAAATSVQPGIHQIPTLDSADINVQLI